MKTCASLMVIGLLLSTPALAGEMDAINALADKNVAAVNAHDAKTWASTYSKTAVLIPAGQPIVEGREAIEKWGEGAAKVWNSLKVTPGKTTLNGETAWQPGTWAGNLNTPDGKAIDLSGNYLMVLAKEGQDWSIIADTWNVNPPKAPEPVVGSSTPPKQ
jgi:ketosteroid isomerase-like protein